MLAQAKARMRELAAEYAHAVPGRDAHSLMAGLPDVKLLFMPMGERDGAYDPEHRVIMINSSVRPERQRFTLAHEISHALLLGDDDLLSDLHDAFEGDRLEQVIETLCNAGAAAILIPAGLMQDMLGRFGPTGRALGELSRRADVSASTALYTLAENTAEPVIYAVCAVTRAERENGSAVSDPKDKELTVRASSAAPGVKYSLRPGTPIPAGHPVETALETRLHITEESFVPFRSGRRMPAFVDAYPERYRVMVSFQVRPDRGSLEITSETLPGGGADA